jgi:CRISPR-associated endonuclease Cas1
MHRQAIASPIPVTADGICVVDGYGIELRIDRGQLIVCDGVGRTRRSTRFARATSGLRRLVLLGHAGFITLEAIRWLEDVGIKFVHLGADGQILLTSASVGLDDARLRRAQAFALGTPYGNEIARSLLRRKLDGQNRLAGRLGRPDVQSEIQSVRTALDVAANPAEMLIPEARAANAYWAAWTPVLVRWAHREQTRVPPHWRCFGTRASPLTGNPRLAANPPNAVLNYLYGLLEAEVRLACFGAGLDPSLGILHVDQRGRDSLALDVMEALRPEVDDTVLNLLEDRTFRAGDFFETRRGVCRVLAPLTHELARTTTIWSRLVAPLVESIAKSLAAAPNSRVNRLPTPLTQTNRSAGREAPRRRGRPTAVPTPTLRRRACVECGAPVALHRQYCEVCRPDIVGFQAAGSEALARLRGDGRDPAHGGEVARIRGAKWRERRRLESEWEARNRKPDPSEFALRLLPAIRSVPTRILVEATGLTRAYCARIQKGELVPHPRHWESIRAACQPPTPGRGSS